MVTPAPAEPGPAGPPPRRRVARWWRVAQGAAFVGAFSFAIWQGVIFFRTPRLSPSPHPGAQAPPESDMPIVTTRPGAGLTAAGAMASAGVETIDADPGDLAPPPEAKRRLARQYRLGEYRRQEGAYDYRGAMRSAEEHYRKTLTAAGFAASGELGGASGWRTLAFTRGPDAATVSLRANPADARIVSIVVVLSVPVRKPD